MDKGIFLGCRKALSTLCSLLFRSIPGYEYSFDAVRRGALNVFHFFPLLFMYEYSFDAVRRGAPLPAAMGVASKANEYSFDAVRRGAPAKY